MTPILASIWYVISLFIYRLSIISRVFYNPFSEMKVSMNFIRDSDLQFIIRIIE